MHGRFPQHSHVGSFSTTFIIPSNDLWNFRCFSFILAGISTTRLNEMPYLWKIMQITSIYSTYHLATKFSCGIEVIWRANIRWYSTYRLAAKSSCGIEAIWRADIRWYSIYRPAMKFSCGIEAIWRVNIRWYSTYRPAMKCSCGI